MTASRTVKKEGRGSERGRPALAHAGLGRAGEEGLGLVEVLVAVAILGMTLVALLAAISTGSIGVTTTDKEVTAANLARSQLEYTRSQTYGVVPYATVTPPAGYAVSVEAASIPEASPYTNIQKITVTVARDGETLATVEDFKVDR